MPRTDVPPPGQGKRSQRKAWRDKADQNIAIYSLTAAESSETTPIEDVEAMSHALPHWDDAPQLHSRSQSPEPQQQTYTKEEAQELVEKAYQEGWQEGMEEGYKLGRDKGYKEHKVQEEEEEAKKSKNRANKAIIIPQDTQNTHSNVTRVNATPETDPTTLKGCASINTTHITQIPPISVTSASNDSKPLSAISSNPTSSISPTASVSSTQIVEIAEIDHQAVAEGAKRSISANTASGNPQTLSAVPRHSMSSILPTPSLPNLQNIEIDDSAPYCTPTSSSTTQAALLPTGNTPNGISDSYVVLNDPQIASSSNYSNPEEHHLIDISISEDIVSDAQTDESTAFLVNYDAQSLAPAPRTSPDAADLSKTPYTSTLHHQLPLGNSTGNPGVRQAYPDPNPRNPVPVSRVPGFAGWGHGFHGLHGLRGYALNKYYFILFFLNYLIYIKKINTGRLETRKRRLEPC
jgi:hypothetical protein